MLGLKKMFGQKQQATSVDSLQYELENLDIDSKLKTAELKDSLAVKLSEASDDEEEKVKEKIKLDLSINPLDAQYSNSPSCEEENSQPVTLNFSYQPTTFKPKVSLPIPINKPRTNSKAEPKQMAKPSSVPMTKLDPLDDKMEPQWNSYIPTHPIPLESHQISSTPLDNEFYVGSLDGYLEKTERKKTFNKK